MYHIGIDIGSTYTKYCIMDENKSIIKLFSEKSPIRQKDYFEKKQKELFSAYYPSQVISCGYGRHNIETFKSINELSALALGVHSQYPNANIILDIGGQDTKIITQKDGKLKEFFINDKCAAGCGLFLANTLNLLQLDFNDINLTQTTNSTISLSSVCAVFAQSEIVELIAKDISPDMILDAVICQILTQAKTLLSKVDQGPILLSGGLSQIPGIDKFSENIFNRNVIIPPNAAYLSTIGCALKE